MSLPEIVKRYESAKKLSTKKIPEKDLRAQRIPLANIRRAKRELEDIIVDYRKEALNNNTLLIVVSGENSEEFGKIAKEEFGAYTVSINDLALELSRDIHEQYYVNSSVNSNVFLQLESGFNLLAMDMGISSYEAVQFEHKYSKKLKNKEEFVDLINKVYSEKLGGETFALYYVHTVAKQALSDSFGGKLIPIIVDAGNNLELANRIVEDAPRIGVTSTLLSLKAKELTKESVEKELVKAKKQINKRGK